MSWLLDGGRRRAGALAVAGFALTLAAVALSFLIFSDPAVMSWGSMVGAGQPVLPTASYVTGPPRLAIVASVIGFMLLGHALSDVLNFGNSGR